MTDDSASASPPRGEGEGPRSSSGTDSSHPASQARANANRVLELQAHPSMLETAKSQSCGDVEIIDVTSEVIRDYWNEPNMSANGGRPAAGQPRRTSDQQDLRDQQRRGSPKSSKDSTVSTLSGQRDDVASLTAAGSSGHATDAASAPVTPAPGHLPNLEGSANIPSPHSYDMIHSAAAQLLDLGCSAPGAPPNVDASQNALLHPATHSSNPSIASPGSEGMSHDGIFLPGSAYLEFHSALRSHTFYAARSALPSRCGTPECPETAHAATRAEDTVSALDDVALSRPTPRLSELSQQEEFELWKNWVDEIGPWLDKFDNQRRFVRVLPPLAREHPHLRFSMLALSARQLERKFPDRPATSLGLYQEAIHQLVPQLQTRTTTVVASCVVLCVLEMMSCSPKMWRRHLDGSASLILSLGINGFSGGLEQALFWCFARMDLCGALISDERTIIPIESWLPKPAANENVHLAYSAAGFDMYANYIVHLCAEAMDLFADSTKGREDFNRRWSSLFSRLNDWYHLRPPEMRPVLDLPQLETEPERPFPILLFSNPSAISGNQMYHTAALLMLQRIPRSTRLPPGTRSMLWHARRICAISISNTDHACWTNCIQPLWIAGRIMSNPSEHRAILKTYELIEKETGWGAKWRADDLRTFWGDLDGG
ncbi:hypothetical protein INS49_000890 [Diaporthe citri]|uniref:uncharacterized protein n=1 Tax=Diaporthe citri TaxID=83186 RepID=UPI001C7F843A|nr:uncharacterized protein INS49_000890 [Diaporthe citri]KAG6366711.1 hypothetical protein INS49_000890 [Diaporthe citri]